MPNYLDSRSTMFLSVLLSLYPVCPRFPDSEQIRSVMRSVSHCARTKMCQMMEGERERGREVEVERERGGGGGGGEKEHFWLVLESSVSSGLLKSSINIMYLSTCVRALPVRTSLACNISTSWRRITFSNSLGPSCPLPSHRAPLSVMLAKSEPVTWMRGRKS